MATTERRENQHGSTCIVISMPVRCHLPDIVFSYGRLAMSAVSGEEASRALPSPAYQSPLDFEILLDRSTASLLSLLVHWAAAECLQRLRSSLISPHKCVLCYERGTTHGSSSFAQGRTVHAAPLLSYSLFFLLCFPSTSCCISSAQACESRCRLLGSFSVCFLPQRR